MCMKKPEKIKVKCNLCKATFDLDASTAKRITSHHDGFIPCERCGSHATQWDTTKLN